MYRFAILIGLLLLPNLALADTCEARLFSGYHTQIGSSCLAYGSICMLESAINRPISAAFLGANYLLYQFDGKDIPDVTEIAQKFGVLPADLLQLSAAFCEFFQIPNSLNSEAALARVTRDLFNRFELAPQSISRMEMGVFRSEIDHLRSLSGRASLLGLGPDRIQRYYSKSYLGTGFKSLFLHLIAIKPELFYDLGGVRVERAQEILTQVRESLQRKVAATITIDTARWYDNLGTAYLDRPYALEILSRPFQRRNEPLHVISVVGFRSDGQSYVYTLRDTQFEHSGVGELELTEKQLRRILVEGFIYR